MFERQFSRNKKIEVIMKIDKKKLNTKSNNSKEKWKNSLKEKRENRITKLL